MAYTPYLIWLLSWLRCGSYTCGKLFMQTLEASIAIYVAALLHISSSCFAMGMPLAATSSVSLQTKQSALFSL